MITLSLGGSSLFIKPIDYEDPFEAAQKDCFSPSKIELPKFGRRCLFTKFIFVFFQTMSQHRMALRRIRILLTGGTWIWIERLKVSSSSVKEDRLCCSISFNFAPLSSFCSFIYLSAMSSSSPRQSPSSFLLHNQTVPAIPPPPTRTASVAVANQPQQHQMQQQNQQNMPSHSYIPQVSPN